MAITLVGMRTIKNFALWSAVFSLAPNPKCGPFDLRMLWQDSLRRALFARKMGTLLQLEDPEEVFIAALLQDIAIPLLADYKPEIYSQLMEASKSRNLRLSFVEKKVIGWTHGEAGGKIIRHWMLPDEFACIVEKHHLIDEMDPQQDETPNAFIVALSSLLPSVAQEDWGEKEAFVENFLTFKEISESDIEPVFGNVDEEIGEFAQILRIAPPKVGLREILANSEEEEEDEEKEEGGEGED